MQENDQTRREFIRFLGAGGLGLMALTAPWLSVFSGTQLPSKRPSDKVRLAFIGTGSRGNYLLTFLKEIQDTDNVEVVAVCDNYEPNLKEALRITKGTAKGYDDYHKVLDIKDLDGVLVATPLHEHAHIVLDALNAGLHVFCEKAMARNLADTRKMYDTSRLSGKILQIGHQRLFHPVYLSAIDQIKKGAIGKVTQMRAYWHRNNNWRRPVPSPELERKINWRLYTEYSCGLMTELASHQLQVANWVKGSPPVSVMGTGSINYWKDGREVYDNVALVYSYSDGTKFVYDSTTSNKFYGLEEQILGDKGTMELETNKVYSENPPQVPGIRQLINDMEKGVFKSISLAGTSWVPETAVRYNGEFINPEYTVDESKLQLIGFVAAIRQNKQIPGLLDEAYNSSIWILLGQQAIDEQKILTLPSEFVI